METAVGRVESVRDETITVVVEAPVACRRCSAGKGCGAGLLTGAESERRIEVTQPPGLRLDVGDVVLLSVSPRQLLRAASIAYGLPLIALVAGAGLAWLAGAGPSDLVALALTTAGLCVGLFLSRRLLSQDKACEHFVPSIEGRPGG